MCIFLITVIYPDAFTGNDESRMGPSDKKRRRLSAEEISRVNLEMLNGKNHVYKRFSRG